MKKRQLTTGPVDHNGLPIEDTARVMVGNYTQQFDNRVASQRRESAAIGAQRVFSQTFRELVRSGDEVSRETIEGLHREAGKLSLDASEALTEKGRAQVSEKAALWDAHEHFGMNKAAYQQTALEDGPPGLVMDFERTHEEQLKEIGQIHQRQKAQPE